MTKKRKKARSVAQPLADVQTLAEVRANQDVELTNFNGEVIHPITRGECVLLDSGSNIDNVIGESNKLSPIIKQTKAMSKYGVGSNVDVSANVQDGVLKSAILFGNTMVNEQTKTVVGYNRGIEKIDVNKGVKFKYHELEAMINFDKFTFKPNTKYILKALYTKNNNVDEGSYIRCNQSDGSNIDDFRIITSSTNNGEIYRIFTTKANVNNILSFRLYLNKNVEAEVTLDNIRIIEYQDGMENWDIPYFTGMQSSKMPVLRTVGKNKFNPFDYRSGGNNTSITPDKIVINSSTAFATTEYLLKGFEVGKRYYLSQTKTNRGEISVRKLDGTSSIYIEGSVGFLENPFIYEDGMFVRITNRSVLDAECIFENIQIEEVSYTTPSATSYEPYKTNILECLEPVELGSVGNVKDTLDLLTGEVINNFDTVNYNGSQTSWMIHPDTSKLTNCMHFVIAANNIKLNAKILCDRFKTITYNNTLDVECIMIGGSKQIHIKILKSKLTNETTTGFVDWLKNNNTIVCVEREIPLLKTVDLSGVPYGFKNGHISLSSESGSLIPTMDYSVPTNLNGVIETNATAIQIHDSQLDSLENIFIPTNEVEFS